MLNRLKALFTKKPEPFVIRPSKPWKPDTSPRGSAHLLPGRIAIITHGREAGGAYLESGCVILPLPASDESLGAAVLQSLDDFQFPFDPPDYQAIRKNQLKAFGVRSETELHAQALHCSFVRRPEGFQFEPSHNGGSRGDEKGFRPLPEANFTLPLTSTPSELGAALRKAFSLSTTVNDRPDDI